MRSVDVHLFELTGDEYKPVASALAGERFHITKPFEVSFDPDVLLEP